MTDNNQDAQNRLFDMANIDGALAADSLSASFKRASRDIANALNDAATSGELSMKKLANSILRDLSNIAISQYVTKPLENIISSAIGAIPNYGARAGGGAVNVGGAYLVGENGPEYFVPKTAGNIETTLSSPINIHINMAQGSNLGDVKKSANQVAIALARAVDMGRGRI
jgi:Lambda phage tail tape-measure protein (Tape_meas_lam_C)